MPWVLLSPAWRTPHCADAKSESAVMGLCENTQTAGQLTYAIGISSSGRVVIPLPPWSRRERRGTRCQRRLLFERTSRRRNCAVWRGRVETPGSAGGSWRLRQRPRVAAGPRWSELVARRGGLSLATEHASAFGPTAPRRCRGAAVRRRSCALSTPALARGAGVPDAAGRTGLG